MKRALRDAVRWPIFLGLSVGVHAAAFDAASKRSEAAAPLFESSSKPLAGDTLDMEPIDEPPDEVDDTAAPAAPGGGSPATPAQATEGTHARHRASASALMAGASASAADRNPSKAGEAAAPPHPLFGAVGVRFATDLATTFTRAFPQAASADPIWPTMPFGSAGSAELTLLLGDDGHLVHSAIGGSPSVALRRGIERTLVLLGTDRPFTARGATTRLRVSAHVMRDDLHDGLHGDVFALSGGSFARDVGSAFFALPPAGGPGRRIDVEVRLLP